LSAVFFCLPLGFSEQVALACFVLKGFKPLIFSEKRQNFVVT
jgi:hypothetical protein